MIGVTGTKGKTTTAHMIKAILESCGKKVGMIGTNGTFIGDQVTPNLNTTPESYQLHQAFAKMVEAGCQYLVMEVSSQGIKMRRTDGIFFDYGLFTIISPDHIGPDEHKDFKEYLYYKSRLLSMCKVGLVNRSDPHFDEIVEDASCELYTYRVKWRENRIRRGKLILRPAASTMCRSPDLWARNLRCRAAFPWRYGLGIQVSSMWIMPWGR